MRTALVAALLPAAALAQSYSLFRNHQGATFFDGLDFVSGYDNTTTGNVDYASGIGPNALIQGGQAVLRVDNGTVVNNGSRTLRGSAKIRTREAYGQGNVFVLDAAHVPYGCSVWPAFYTVADQSLQQWPQGGEFDIYEQQNLGAYTQMSLHVAGPNNVTACTMPSSTVQAARHMANNCDAWENDNAGCAAWDERATSFGAGFNSAGGGIWAVQFDTVGVNMWFFSRAGTIPTDLAGTSTSVDPSAWGEPTASFPFTSSCQDGSSLFAPQQLIITTTLCGQWAGIPSIFALSTQCSGTCLSNVVGNGRVYNEAYWSINSLRVFSLTAAGNASIGGVPVTGAASTSSSVALPTSATANVPAVVNAAQTTAPALPSATSAKLKGAASTLALPIGGGVVAAALALLTLA